MKMYLHAQGMTDNKDNASETITEAIGQTMTAANRGDVPCEIYDKYGNSGMTSRIMEVIWPRKIPSIYAA